MAALLHHALDLGDGRVDVPEGHDGGRDVAARVFPAPLVDMPVVITRHEDLGVFLVLEREEQAAVEGHGAGEVDRGQDAVDVHVVDARVDVVDAGAHLVERDGLHPVFLARPADHGVQARARRPATFEYPVIGALLVVLDVGGQVLVLRAEVRVPHRGRFDDVIVDAHDDHVFHLHDIVLFSVAHPGRAPLRFVDRSGGKIFSQLRRGPLRGGPSCCCGTPA